LNCFEKLTNDEDPSTECYIFGIINPEESVPIVAPDELEAENDQLPSNSEEHVDFGTAVHSVADSGAEGDLDVDGITLFS
jgi:hypothetical protein